MPGGMFCSAASPMVPGLMRTPSTSTSVWLLSAPRMKMAVVWPGPPLRPRSRPAWKRSSSVTSVAALRSIAARSMTMTGASTSSIGVGMRVAVTTRWSGLGTESDADAAVAHAAPASSSKKRLIDAGPRARPCGLVGIQPRAREWQGGAQGRGTRPLALREAGLVRQAGLRAFEWTFPRSRPHPLPAMLAVGAGLLRAMQARLDYRCGGSAGIGPASRSPARAARDHLSVRAR